MTFEFQLVLTEECNMACTYCYIDQKKKVMSKEIFNAHYALLPFIMEKYDQEYYNAALFGGEPLLNWDLIEYIVPIFQNDPKCQNIIVMTNGLVFQKEGKLQWLLDNKVNISLSFDGLWNIKNRPLKSGESSLPIYMDKDKPLYKYLTSGTSCKVMIAPESVDSMVENYEWFINTLGITSPDYSLVRDHNWDEHSVSKFRIEIKKLADTNIKYIKDGTRSMIGFFQLAILDMLFGETYGKRPFGCFAGCNGAGFMPDGKVYPCARFGSNDKYMLFDSVNKKIHKKNIEKLNSPQVSNPKNYEKCQECVIRQYCNAGCTYSQLDNCNGEKCEPLDTVCELYYSLYEEAIRITHELRDNKIFRSIIKDAIRNIG
jgi:radical SAM protein with 4Fe4S-binding SPASM domain